MTTKTAIMQLADLGYDDNAKYLTCVELVSITLHGIHPDEFEHVKDETLSEWLITSILWDKTGSRIFIKWPMLYDDLQRLGL